MRWHCFRPAVVALALLGLAVPGTAAEKKKTDQAVKKAETPAAKEKTITLAEIKLTGDLDETPLPEETLLVSRENFQSKLNRIKKAREDKNVQALLLNITELGVGWGKVDELRRAVADFRKSGKKVYAYMDSAATKDYLVAIACDRVCLPESGWLMLVGVRGEVTFYKDLLDKIHIKADMLQMGSYKGAAEPYTRSSMSKPFRERLESVLDDYYKESIIAPIAKLRGKLTPAQVQKLIDQGPFTAQRAKAAGLIDEVAYEDQFLRSLKKEGKADHLKVVRDYGKAKTSEADLNNPFAVLRVLLGSSRKRSSNKDKVAVIYVTGTIVYGKSSISLFGGESVGSTTLIQAIRKAEEDKTVKAIVLRVDSPGGSALASDLIWNELNRCKKPVVASMSDVAASGGYYVSMGSRKIFAEPGTLTGSIGVVGGKIVLGGLEKKVGINTEVISRGANSGILSSTFPFSPSEKEAMTAMMKDTYEQFLTKAIQGRARAGKKFTRADFLKYAEGRIWTGRQAKAIGLVDALGTLEDAINTAKVMGKMPSDSTPELLILPRPRSFLDQLLEGKIGLGLSAPAIKELGLLKMVPELAGHLQAVDGLLQLRGEPVWLIVPHRIVIR